MAQKQTYDVPAEYQYKYRADYQSDWTIHRNYIQTFDAYEAMLMSQVYDAVSNSIDSSKITDSYATTLAKERADRVMAKLPDGVVEPTGKADVGKAAFMDILRQKWIYPNANAQHSFQEKLNMWQLYSSVYGYMPMFYDWSVDSSGYVGPNCWLWSPRNLVPQQGRTSIADMDYVTALTWVGKKYLEDILEDVTGDGDDEVENKEETGGWDIAALQLLIDQAEHQQGPDFEKDTKVSRDRTPQATRKGICLATRYEAGEGGKWCTFAPDNGNIQVREIENPHKNGKIPFVIKYSQPLFDSFYGLGDFQRAKPLQFARDGLTNFYFKGIKMNLIPPIIANANGVMKHTLDYREGAVMLETIPNSIRRLETSTAGLATYQAAESALTGSLLSLFGSQNAADPAAQTLNPSQGKTPQAINLYADKEATRDGAERRHLEDAIEQLTEGFFSLVVNIGTEDIPVTLFADDIEDIIKSGLSDLKDIFKNFKPNDNGSAGDLTIDPTKLKGVEYRFKIDPDSTAKVNKQAILQALQDLMDRIGKMQNVFQDNPQLTIHWDKIMTTYEELTDIPNASQFITFNPDAPTKAEAEQQQAAQAQPPAPTPTSLQLPGGQVHEAADLTKLYLGTADEGLKTQIVQALGFQPSPPPVSPPTTISSGHSFHDPNIAAAAEALNQHPAIAAPPPPTQAPETPQAPEPTVTSSGHTFHDGTIGQAAEALNQAAAPLPPVEPKPPTEKVSKSKK